MTNADTAPLSPRHERFVLEYLKDANATQAYIRAGYSARGAQPSASKLLRHPGIALAIAAGRQRIGRAIELSVERLAQEYAQIAFARVDDFVITDEEGHISVDIEKASAAQRAGIVELRISNHRNPEQRQVTLKLGKLQALAALTKNIGVLVQKPVPGPTVEELQRSRDRCTGLERQLDDRNQERLRMEAELRQARAALAEAQGKLDAASRESAAVAQPAPPDEAPATAYASGVKPIPRSPQEAESLLDLARWETPGGPQVQPLTDAEYERLLKRGELSSAEAMKYLLRRR